MPRKCITLKALAALNRWRWCYSHHKVLGPAGWKRFTPAARLIKKKKKLGSSVTVTAAFLSQDSKLRFFLSQGSGAEARGPWSIIRVLQNAHYFPWNRCIEQIQWIVGEASRAGERFSFLRVLWVWTLRPIAKFHTSVVGRKCNHNGNKGVICNLHCRILNVPWNLRTIFFSLVVILCS